MNYPEQEDRFYYQFRRGLIFYTVEQLSERRVRDAAMYYFNDNREELAMRLSKKLGYSPVYTGEFYEHFKPSRWSLIGIIEKILIGPKFYSPPQRGSEECSCTSKTHIQK